MRARTSVNSPLVSSTSFLMWLLHIDSSVHWLNIQSCLSIYKRFKNKTLNEHTQMVCHLVYSCFGMTSSKSWMFFSSLFLSLSFYLSSTNSWNVCVFMFAFHSVYLLSYILRTEEVNVLKSLHERSSKISFHKRFVCRLSIWFEWN